MRKLFYMGLESYEARYTLQLTEWNRRVFDRRGLDVVYVPGTTIDDTKSISVGQVLDAHGRIVLRPQNITLQEMLDSVVDILSLESEEKGDGSIFCDM